MLSPLHATKVLVAAACFPRRRDGFLAGAGVHIYFALRKRKTTGRG
jgi:hypothetical protein